MIIRAGQQSYSIRCRSVSLLLYQTPRRVCRAIDRPPCSRGSRNVVAATVLGRTPLRASQGRCRVLCCAERPAAEGRQLREGVPHLHAVGVRDGARLAGRHVAHLQTLQRHAQPAPVSRPARCKPSADPGTRHVDSSRSDSSH